MPDMLKHNFGVDRDLIALPVFLIPQADQPMHLPPPHHHNLPFFVFHNNESYVHGRESAAEMTGCLVEQNRGRMYHGDSCTRA